MAGCDKRLALMISAGVFFVLTLICFGLYIHIFSEHISEHPVVLILIGTIGICMLLWIVLFFGALKRHRVLLFIFLIGEGIVLGLSSVGNIYLLFGGQPNFGSILGCSIGWLVWFYTQKFYEEVKREEYSLAGQGKDVEAMPPPYQES